LLRRPSDTLRSANLHSTWSAGSQAGPSVRRRSIGRHATPLPTVDRPGGIGGAARRCLCPIKRRRRAAPGEAPRDRFLAARPQLSPACRRLRCRVDSSLVVSAPPPTLVYDLSSERTTATRTPVAAVGR